MHQIQGVRQSAGKAVAPLVIDEDIVALVQEIVNGFIKLFAKLTQAVDNDNIGLGTLGQKVFVIDFCAVEGPKFPRVFIIFQNCFHFGDFFRKFPVFYDGDENVTHIRWDSETTVETVVLLSRDKR